MVFLLPLQVHAMGRARLPYASAGGSRDFAATPKLDEKIVDANHFITMVDLRYLNNRVTI